MEQNIYPLGKVITIILFIFIILITFFYIVFNFKGTGVIKEHYVTFENDLKLNVEVADNDEKRTTGLMFREKLDENSGMLFIFDGESIRNFWMKNTLMPLDMIFLDSNKKIVDIITNAIPCKADPCNFYSSESPSKYVVEVNSGYVKKNNISIGQKVIFSGS